MLWVKAFHIIAMVAWFAGLFYLPRLFVYHSNNNDINTVQCFEVMERRLYFGIMWPAALLTTVLGIWLILFNPNYYLHAGWLHAKLSIVILIWAYHLTCGYYRKQFLANKNNKSPRFFRFFNEVPTILLISIVLLVVVKPFH